SRVNARPGTGSWSTRAKSSAWAGAPARAPITAAEQSSATHRRRMPVIPQLPSEGRQATVGRPESDVFRSSRLTVRHPWARWNTSTATQSCTCRDIEGEPAHFRARGRGDVHPHTLGRVSWKVCPLRKRVCGDGPRGDSQL